MPQIQRPIFPTSCTAMTQELAFEQREGTVYYFNGHLPVFSHPVDDIASFRFFTSQLISNGNASQGEIVRAFGVPLVTVKRSCKKLRDEGAAGFFRPAEPRLGHKLTDDGRSFVRGLMNTTINLRPNLARRELRVELQGQANPIHDDAVASFAPNSTPLRLTIPERTCG